MTGEHEPTPEREAEAFGELETGKNSKGEPVGLGVSVRPLDVVLQQRFADMDTLPASVDAYVGPRERLNARPITDSRLEMRRRREENARRVSGHNAGKVTSSSVSKPTTDAEKAEAKELLSKGVDSVTVARTLNIAHRSVRKMLENGA